MPFGGLLTAGLITAGTSIFSGLEGSSAADKAASAQEQAEQQVQNLAGKTIPQANDLYQNNYNTNLGLLSPYSSTGTNALTQLNSLINGGGFQAPTAAQAAAMPGYAFQQQQGIQALDRSAASKGEALGGGQVKAAEQYGQGLAQTDYNNAYNQALGTYQTNFGNLQQLAGLGLNATNTGVNSGNINAAGQSSNLLQGLGIQSDALTGAANARASGYLSSASALAGGANGVGAAASGVGSGLNQLSLLSKLLGINNSSSGLGIQPTATATSDSDFS